MVCYKKYSKALRNPNAYGNMVNYKRYGIDFKNTNLLDTFGK